MNNACVHGRFQPPHLDHLEYIQEALSRCEHLFIGITQPNSVLLDECAINPHRAWPSENPLSYEERCEFIRSMLIAEGVDPGRFSFIPFKIDRPGELAIELSTSITCYTTIRDKWNLEKIEILKNLGYPVEVLWDRREAQGIRGTDIRKNIRDGSTDWEASVHVEVIRLMKERGIIERIQSSADNS